MSSVWVVPSIVPDYTQQCLATISPELIPHDAIPGPPSGVQRDWHVVTVNGNTWTDGKPDMRLMVVWNTPDHNLGVGQSWELGRQETLRSHADWLVILSAGVRFGGAGGLDFAQRLSDFQETRPDALAVEAGNGLGWHCIAFPRSVLERVGAFDHIYEVGYFEDVDYSWRIQCAYGLTPADYPLWPKVEIDATLPEIAHGIIRSGVHVDMAENERRFHAKWGGPSGSEQWCSPYNDESLDHTFTGFHAVAGVE